jgi:hypothetical protein
MQNQNSDIEKTGKGPARETENRDTLIGSDSTVPPYQQVRKLQTIDHPNVSI